MAKSKTITRYVAAAAPAARRAGAIARRGVSAASRFAADEKHTFTALAAAALAGYLRGSGTASRLPTIDALGMEGTYGLVAWGAARYTRNRTLEHVATGLLAVAASRWGEQMGTGGGGGAARGDVDY